MPSASASARMWLTNIDTINVDSASAAESRCPWPRPASDQNRQPNSTKSDTRSVTESRNAPARLSSPRRRANPPSKMSSSPASIRSSPGTSRRPVTSSHPIRPLVARDRKVSCHGRKPARYRPARATRYGHLNTVRNSGPIALSLRRGPGRSRTRGGWPLSMVASAYPHEVCRFRTAEPRRVALGPALGQDSRREEGRYEPASEGPDGFGGPGRGEGGIEGPGGGEEGGGAR